MLAFWPVYRIQLWTLHDHEGQQYYIFDESRVTRKNGLCSQLYAAEK